MDRSDNKTGVQGLNGLKLLCVLSVLGFIYCMAYDSTKYLTYSNYDSSVTIKDAMAYEVIEEELEKWGNNGISIGKTGISKIALMFLFRSIIDVLALLGVGLMFFRLKLGFIIYIIFQVSYVILPFIILGIKANIIIPLGTMAVHLIYVALFITQRKHLLQ